MKKKSSPIDSDMNFVSDLGFTDHSEMFSASYRGFISRNKNMYVYYLGVHQLPPPAFRMNSIIIIAMVFFNGRYFKEIMRFFLPSNKN